MSGITKLGPIKKFEVDLEDATEDELERVKGAIMSRLVRDALNKVELGERYDQHQSYHVKNSPPQQQ